jgi:hypothetical protein
LKIDDGDGIGVVVGDEANTRRPSIYDDAS